MKNQKGYINSFFDVIVYIVIFGMFMVFFRNIAYETAYKDVKPNTVYALVDSNPFDRNTLIVLDKQEYYVKIKTVDGQEYSMKFSEFNNKYRKIDK